MRLSPHEVNAIKAAFAKHLPGVDVYLYGSRVDDSKHGGDIDLLIYVTDKVDLEIQSRIYWAICEQIGEQKIDMLFTRADSTDPFLELIRGQAVKL